MTDIEKKSPQKEIVMYTMNSCAFCAQLKKVMHDNEIEFIEKDAQQYAKEWDEVKLITMIPVFPTLYMDGEFLIPRRDFQNVQDGLEVIQNRLNPEWTAPSLELRLLEGIKTLNGGLNMMGQNFPPIQQHLQKIHENLNLLQKQEEIEPTREP